MCSLLPGDPSLEVAAPAPESTEQPRAAPDLEAVQARARIGVALVEVLLEALLRPSPVRSYSGKWCSSVAASDVPDHSILSCFLTAQQGLQHDRLLESLARRSVAWHEQPFLWTLMTLSCVPPFLKPSSAHAAGASHLRDLRTAAGAAAWEHRGACRRWRTPLRGSARACGCTHASVQGFIAAPRQALLPGVWSGCAVAT